MEDIWLFIGIREINISQILNIYVKDEMTHFKMFHDSESFRAKTSKMGCEEVLAKCKHLIRYDNSTKNKISMLDINQGATREN